MEAEFSLHANPLIKFANKLPSEFTKNDIIHIIESFDVRLIHFRYVAEDGRLKCLSVPVIDKEYIDTVLSYGERVDGSSLFPLIEADSSDLYVIPRFRTAYLDPFAEVPTLGLFCSYFTKDGLPLEQAPEYTLYKAHRSFTKRSGGLHFEAMGELEFYISGPADDRFPASDQKGYHESSPFVKYEAFREEAIDLIARVGGRIKYGHSEVGNFTFKGRYYEQNEIEFMVCPVEEAADQLVLAKWVLRVLAYKHGVDLTFSPKITAGKAGNGLHFHTRMLDARGRDVMLQDGRLSDTARKAIAGYMLCAPALTAFGNTNPVSYFRLVPHQEAPTNVCWGDSNRSVLVRVPLGWTKSVNMVAAANPMEAQEPLPIPAKQTVEMRSPDGSADIYRMLAGLMVAAVTGLNHPRALEIAEKTYVNINIHKAENKEKFSDLAQLPASCWASAEALEKSRAIFEKDGVFSTTLIDGCIERLRGFEDRDLRREISRNPEKMLALVEKFYHCG